MINFRKIVEFQKATGLPVLLDQGNGFFKLNEYTLIETPLKSYNSELTGIEIPNNWVIVQDSSGSMGGFPYAGTGTRFDVLNRVKYGLFKGLYDVCKLMGKDLKVGVVNFSSITQYAGLDSLVKIYDARSHKIKSVSLLPQSGGTELNTKVFTQIQKDLAPGTSVFTLISDGDIFNSSQVYQAITKLAQRPETAFMFFEVGHISQLGHQVDALSKTKPNVSYYHGGGIAEIKDQMSSVLIRYK